MPKSKRTLWRYVAIPVEQADEITKIVEKDRYPLGHWHSKDHYVIEKLKKAIAEDKALQEEKKNE